MAAFVAGEPADLDRAAERAAALLRAGRFPLVAGLGTDVAGAKAALRLAARLRGAFDHMASAALLRDIRVLQDSGAMTTVPAEARRRADLLLLVGPGAGDPAWLEPVFDVPPSFGDGRRDAIWLCGAARPAPGLAPGGTLTRIGDSPRDLPGLIGLIRAGLMARPVSLPFAGLDRNGLAALVERLRTARFGVAAIDPADLDPLAIGNLYGLVKELNVVTRFSVLRRPGPDNAAAVNEVCVWTTGGPLRVGFGRGFPEHDPWRFEAARVIEAGEADAALWISAFRPEAPAWTKPVPTVALMAPGGSPGSAAVLIEVGVPGRDHDGVLASPRSGALAHVAAAERSNLPAVAEVLERIEARLAPDPAPC
jgi:formylmethanofuran dehydrogenase subunit B